MNSVPKKSQAPMLSLSLSEIKHEWMLNSILVISIASIIAPLLILLGLKYGLIDYWTTSLVQDPVNREITPSVLEAENKFTEDWIQKYSKRQEVQFLVPMTRSASSNVTIKVRGKIHLLDLFPTDKGDALLLENNGKIPNEGEAVITRRAANDYGIDLNESLQVKITRMVKGKKKSVEEKFKIISILSPRAGMLPRMYASKVFVSDVEKYKDGNAVPERGWKGASSLPKILMDGVYIITDKPLSDKNKSLLVMHTGFTELEEFSNKDLINLYNLKFEQKKYVYKLKVFKSPVGLKSYRQIKNKLRGTFNILIPFVNNIELINKSTNKNLKYIALSLSEKKSLALGLTPQPWGDLTEKRIFKDIAVAVSSWYTKNEANKTPLIITVKTKNNKTIELPILVSGSVNLKSDKSIIIPFELIGMFRSGLVREIEYDKHVNSLNYARSGYYGFRMYAKTIDDVLKIEEDLRKKGIKTNTAAASISRIKMIDSGLSNMFWLIAIVGILGGLTTLIASFFASVKRKTKELGIMRLLGISASQIFRFPIYQSIIISSVSVLLAFVAYFTLANVINNVFSQDLPLGQKICYMPFEYLFFAGLITISASVLSSFIAAYQTTKIDPAEAIRDE